VPRRCNANNSEEDALPIRNGSIAGVGPADVLTRAGADVLADMPAVGRNLIDHLMFSISFRMKNDSGFNREFDSWRLMRHVLKYYLTRKGLMA
jgi:choline dehydrogenase